MSTSIGDLGELVELETNHIKEEKKLNASTKIHNSIEIHNVLFSNIPL